MCSPFLFRVCLMVAIIELLYSNASTWKGYVASNGNDAIWYEYSMNSLILLHRWGYLYDEKKWELLKSEVTFHKLVS